MSSESRFTVLATLAAIVFLAAMLSHAAALDPFLNQPGALSAQEIQAATDAMKPMLGTGPALPLVASGKRKPGHPMPSYVLFAGPLVDFSDRVKTRRQVICNYVNLWSKWQCTVPQDEFRMSANGLEHVFSHQILQGSGNKQAAVDAAAFIHSRCFGAQFEAIGGKPFTPSPDSDFVSAVRDDGKRFTVLTGQLEEGNAYGLEKTDKAQDGCGFRIHHARLAKSGVMIPASAALEYAKEMERLAAERREVEAAQQRELEAAQQRKEVAERPRAREERVEQSRITLGPWSIVGEDIATVTMFGAMICGGLALIVPWSWLGLGRWPAAGAAGVLALLCTILAAVSNAYTSGKYKIPLDLLINGFLMMVAWARFVGLALRATADEPARYRNLRLGLWTLLLAFVIFPVGVVVLQSMYAFESPGGKELSILFFWPVYAALLITTDTAAVSVLSLGFHFLYCFAIVWTVAWLWSKRSTSISGNR